MNVCSQQLYVCSLHALLCITPSKFCNDDKQKTALPERERERFNEAEKRVRERCTVPVE